MLGMFLVVALAAMLVMGAASTSTSFTGGGRALLGTGVHGGILVPLQRREQSNGRRHLLRSGALPVKGSVREVGYFYTTLALGTPAREFSVIIDTGSTITYIPCKGCAHCGKHQDEWFDPESSSSAKRLTCSDSLCDCGTPSCSCMNDKCYYSRTYAERSSSEGWMVEDVFGFPDRQPAVRMVFGCENGETGEIYRQMADGIMGMGNNRNAFQSQLVARGVIEDVFSLCFGYPKDGVLLLGDVAMPSSAQTAYTPLLSNTHLHYYNIKMEGIVVGGTKLPLDVNIFGRGYGAVLDSGTTFTYLPSEAFKAMAAEIGEHAESHGMTSTPGADPQYNDICWKGAKDDFKDLEQHFPIAEFVLGGGARLLLPPLRYLFISRPGEYCLGVFDNGGSGTLIGGVSVRDVVITYDRRNSRVGFTSMSCEAVTADLAARAAAAATSPFPTPANTTALASSPSLSLSSSPSFGKPEISPLSPSSSTTSSSSPSARANFTTAQSEASRSASVAAALPSQPPAATGGAFSFVALNVNYSILVGVVAAIGALFLAGELLFLRRSTLLELIGRAVTLLRGGGGGGGAEGRQGVAEVVPLTGGRGRGGKKGSALGDVENGTS